jgi:hypothetical protein
MTSRQQTQPTMSTPNNKRLNESGGSGGQRNPKQQRPNQSSNRISFDQVKRAVSSNLPCFHVNFDQVDDSKKVPSAFHAGDMILDHLRKNGVKIDRFSLVGWAGKKLKLGVNNKEDYVKLMATDKWPVHVEHIPISIQKPKFMPDCFALVIRYAPKGMSLDFVKAEITRSIATAESVSCMQYPYARKTDDYRFNVKDMREYDMALNMGRISIGNMMLSVTPFLLGNRMTYCTRCWCLGHLRDKCKTPSPRCRVCLENLIENQEHNCSLQQKCAQCEGKHHSLSSQCQNIQQYRANLKVEVDEALARGQLHRLEPPQQAFQTNQMEFPTLMRPTQSKKPAWGRMQTPMQQNTAESTEMTKVLTALTQQLAIMTENNKRLENKLDEMEMRLLKTTADAERQVTAIKKTLHSLIDVMKKAILPVCEGLKIDIRGQYLPFGTILEELIKETEEQTTVKKRQTAEQLTSSTSASLAANRSDGGNMEKDTE